MKFHEVLIFAIERGESITRTSWRDSGIDARICVQRPDEYSKMQEPYFYYERTENGRLVYRAPCAFTNSDLFADDWEVTD